MPPSPRASEIRAWTGIGLAALALAGVFALMLAISRVPGAETHFPWPVAFFEKGLVIHVVFSFVVWFLCVFAALICAATPVKGDGSGRMLGTPALFCGLAALFLLGVPAVLDRGAPSLNNYVPVIIDPLYYAGLVALAGGVAAVSIRFWTRFDKPRLAEPLYRAIAAGTAVYLLALTCFVLAWILNMSQPPSVRFNEDVFWGGGHALQFLNTLLMIAGWWLLARPGAGGDRPYRWAAGLCVAPVAAMPLLYVLYPADSGALITTFTDMQYLLALPTMAALVGLWRGGVASADPVERLALRLSLAVFLVGGILGLFVDGADTRTPAHYHAVIAGVNLALIGVVYAWIVPATGRPAIAGKAASVSLWGYGMGQLIHSLGLFVAGGYGAPRKTAGAEQGIEALGAQLGLYAMGVGALVAVIGGVTFIWLAARALSRSTSGET
ncbi:MAG: cbb3-type cytochrome c oxidase subunit I [Rhodospirillales bacterium]